MFPPAGLPLFGQLLLISDQLAAPADFLLHDMVSSHLRSRQLSSEGISPKTHSSKAVVVSVSQSLARWRAVGSKMGSNVDRNIDEGNLLFLDLHDTLFDPDEPPSLRPVFDLIRSTVSKISPLYPTQPETDTVLVVVEDISTIEWSGYSTSEISRFCRALSAFCARRSSSLVIRHHLLSPEEPDELFRSLYQLCASYIEVRPLASGRSGAVSGEVSLYPGPSYMLSANISSHSHLILRDKALQYRLTDTGATFFERGTGGAVL